MTDLLAVEVAEIQGEGEDRRPGMTDYELTSMVSDMVSDAEQWIKNDISPSRTRAQRYYQGEVDVEKEDNRSEFVMRVIRDSIEQTVPQLMKIYTGGEYLVSFQAKDVDEAQQSSAADATEAFHHVFFNQNAGWLNLQAMSRDALKAKTGILKVYIREETRVKQVEYQGTLPEFLQIAARDDVDVVESREFEAIQQRVVPIINQVVPERVTMVDATLVVKTRSARIAIDPIAPETFLVNRSATSTQLGYYNLIGEQWVGTVNDAVQMGIDYETARKWSGNGDGSATGDYMDQERRARRQMSRDPYQEQVFKDPTMAPLVFYDLYVYVDQDQDGIAELHHVIGLGKNFGEIVENEIVDDHPYCIGSAIQIEHSVIGESMADNLFDLQDVETQLTRNMLNNQAYVNNPRPIYANDTSLPSLINNRLGYPVKGQPGTVDFLTWPSITADVLTARESFNETRAERTGISKESMGLAAQNLQSSSEVGVLAILGAGLTQPEMIAANLAHQCIAPCAKKVISLLRQHHNGPLDILSKGTYREVTPQAWPEDMDVDVRVGLGTGTREEKLAALTMHARKMEQVFQAALASSGTTDNPWFTEEQYARVTNQILELSNIGQSTEFANSPEETRQWVDQRKAIAASTPPQPSEEDKERAHEQALQDKKDANALQKQAMSDETDLTIQSMKDQTKLTEVATEAALTVQTGEEADLG